MTQIGVINSVGNVTPPVDRFGRRYIEVQKANGAVEWRVAPMTTEEAKAIREQGISTAQRQIGILQARVATSDKRQADAQAVQLMEWQRYLVNMSAIICEQNDSFIWPEQPQEVA